MEKFASLLCGVTNDSLYELKSIIENLRGKLILYTNKIIEYNWEEDSVDVEVCFYARNILETSLTVLLGRIDPFRIITVYNVQSSPSYDLGKRSKSAIEWTGDIVATKRGENLWDFEKTKENFDRAVLSNHQGEIVWKKGFTALADYVEENGISSAWLEEILAIDEQSNFEKCKRLSSELFSSFSKGVHSESVVDISLMYDSVTMKTLIKDLYKLCSTLGLVSQFIGYMIPNISVEDAITDFCEVEEVINGL